MTRDDLKWALGIIGGIAVGLTTSFGLFPWIPDKAQHVISLIAFIYGIVSAKLATSPLPGNMAKTMAEASAPLDPGPKPAA